MKPELIGGVPGNILGMLADLAQKLKHGAISPEELATFLKRRNPFEIIEDILDISVDYGRPIDEQIRRGNYVWVHEELNGRYYTNQGSSNKIIGIILIHFNRKISTTKAAKELHLRNLRSATLQEILFLGELYPELQTRFPILALGSRRKGHGGFYYIPCLTHQESRRHLTQCIDLDIDLDNENNWDPSFRFAAVADC